MLKKQKIGNERRKDVCNFDVKQKRDILQFVLCQVSLSTKIYVVSHKIIDIIDYFLSKLIICFHIYIFEHLNINSTVLSYQC